jgi:hypothetical protein
LNQSVYLSEEHKSQESYIYNRINKCDDIFYIGWRLINLNEKMHYFLGGKGNIQNGGEASDRSRGTYTG